MIGVVGSARLLVVLLALGACRKKHAALEHPVGVPVPQTARNGTDPSRVTAVGDPEAATAEAQVNVQVHVNGKPVPDWARCSVVVYDRDSQVSVRGRGDCGHFVKFDPGEADLVVTLKAGDLQISERIATRAWPGGTQQFPVQMQWAVGRLRIKQVGNTAAHCRMAAAGLVGDLQAAWVPAKPGPHVVLIDCEDAKGSPYHLEAQVEVAAGTDNEVNIAVTPPANTAGVRTVDVPKVPSPAPVPPPSTSEQIPLTRDYKVVPPTPGQDLAGSTKENP